MVTPSFAHAQTACSSGGLVGGISSLLSGSFANLVPVAERGESLNHDRTATNKECFLDGLTVRLREVLIEELTASIVDWINSGFDGNPMFITNFGDFFAEVGDEAVGRFLEDEELDGLCNSFEVKFAITQDYYSSYRDQARCKLSDVIDNLDDFTSGNYRSGGGRNGFWELISGRSDHFSERFDANEEAAEQAISEQREAERLTRNGFKPECKSDEKGEVICDEVETPTEIVEQGAKDVTSGPLRQLEMADEIDEIINALLGQLQKQVLGGGGFRGLSKSSGGSSSYTSKLRKRSTESAESPEVRSNTLVYINGIISTENTYRNTKTQTRNSLDEAESLLVDLIACSPSNEEQVAESSSIISTEITPTLNEVKDEIIASENILIQLEGLQTRAIESESGISLQSVIVEINSIGVHIYGDVLLAEGQRDQVIVDMNSINTDTNEKLLLCPST